MHPILATECYTNRLKKDPSIGRRKMIGQLLLALFRCSTLPLMVPESYLVLTSLPVGLKWSFFVRYTNSGSFESSCLRHKQTIKPCTSQLLSVARYTQHLPKWTDILAMFIQIARDCLMCLARDTQRQERIVFIATKLSIAVHRALLIWYYWLFER